MSILRYLQVMVVDTQLSLPTTALKGDIGYCLDTGLAYQFDGTYWSPSARVQVKKTSASINGKNTGATLIYTLENSTYNFYPIEVVPRSVNISGVITAPTLSIGSNASSYNNIASSSSLSSLLSALSVGSGIPQMTSFSPALSGGTAIYANVTIGAVATTYTILYDIIGFYDV